MVVGRILDGSSCMTVTQKQSESKERAQGKLRPALRTAAYGSADAHKEKKRGRKKAGPTKVVVFFSLAWGVGHCQGEVRRSRTIKIEKNFGDVLTTGHFVERSGYRL